MLLVMVLVIAACAGKSKKASDAPLAEGEEAPFVRLPNPYDVHAKLAPSQAQQEFAQVRVAMAGKDWTRAQELLELMTATYPDLSGPYVNLGIVYTKQEVLDEAEDAYKFAIETNVYNFDAYNQLGNLYREQGRFEEAQQVYTQGLQQWPHHLALNRNIGILYDLYMGKFEEALPHYEMAQKISIFEGEEDRQLKGWIIDLKRRIESNQDE